LPPDPDKYHAEVYFTLESGIALLFVFCTVLSFCTPFVSITLFWSLLFIKINSRDLAYCNYAKNCHFPVFLFMPPRYNLVSIYFPTLFQLGQFTP
jgi:hypothetical protein